MNLNDDNQSFSLLIYYTPEFYQIRVFKASAFSRRAVIMEKDM